ncbi:MAG: hypothetical protein AAF988_07890 [Pseudomonadota bacterium]
MQTILNSGLIWWITVVDIPALSGLFWLIMRHRREQESALRHNQDMLELRCNQLREALSGFKLEVARNYASLVELKDLETRLVHHLLRIEQKLDKTALKAEALSAKETL